MSKLLLLLPCFFAISMAAEFNQAYRNCPSYNCNGLWISYPFWEIKHQTPNELCGYEGFGINCSAIGDRDRAIIPLAGDSYYVDYINYNYSSLVLVDIDATTAVDECPRVRHEIDLNNLPLKFSMLNLNLSFHFNCTQVPPFATPIPCLRSGANQSCFHIVGPEVDYFDWDRYCAEEVVTTVLETGIVRRDRLEAEFSGALNRGFELQWQSIEDCGACEESDGRCGWNFQTDKVMCFCSDGSATTDHCRKGFGTSWKIKLTVGMVSVVVSIVLMSVIFYYVKKPSSSGCIGSVKYRTEDDRNVEAFVNEYGSLSTKRYKYAEIKKMTNSFKVKLGEGGFGSVFKGKLSDGRLVAVKVLNPSKANGQEFINEVASIGRTSHVNVVTLLGFCYGARKRALIYEFMPNGSLEKFAYRHSDPLPTSEHLGVKKLYEIAVGIARGLDYLHRGCNTRILHLDIKPHNILLDEDFCPKIADFGLAKLYSRKESIVSMLEARGTIGYIAPEVFSRNFGAVSHKSDVYSYGMMILEICGGRKNVDAGVGSGQSTSEIYFPNWIYKSLEKEEVLLEGLGSEEENDFARKMIIVGLWCIQTHPQQRPSIDEVIEMLEGSTEALQLPPKPFFSSPQRSQVLTFNTSHSVLL